MSPAIADPRVDSHDGAMEQTMSMRMMRVILPGLLLAASNVGAATFQVSNTSNSGAGSLRQAVLDANALAGADAITFAIAGSGPHMIALQSGAPIAIGPLLVDGYSQASAHANTQTPGQGGLNGNLQIVIVPGASAPASSAFVLNNGEVTLRGLVISGFGASGGVNVSGASAIARIEGCYFGTDASGSLAYTTSASRGLFVSSGRVHVGGVSPAQRNLLSGHAIDAIQLNTTTAANSTIEGNLFGTIANGLGALGNGSALKVRSSGAFAMRALRIGGTDSAARNVFAASVNAAIRLDCAAIAQTDCLDELVIQGNAIGTDVTGLHALPNGNSCPLQGCTGAAASAIDLSGLTVGKLTIGGTMPGAGNLIAFNRGVGIGWEVSAGTVTGAVDIVGNAMSYNTANGIALIRANVATTNDPGDADEGPNRFQNSPVIASAVAQSAGSELVLSYRVDTAISSATYPLRIDFYRSDDGEEGDEYLGSDIYPALSAQLDKSVVLTLQAGVSGLPVVATATDAEGHTSPFSLGDLIFRSDFE